MKKYVFMLAMAVVCSILCSPGKLSCAESEKINPASAQMAADENTVLLFNFGPGEIVGDKVSDLSGNGNDGKRLNEWTVWSDGKRGEKDQAASFNADSWTYLGVEKSETLISPKNGLTIELWLKLNEASKTQSSGYLVLFTSENGANGYGLYLEKDKLIFVLGNGVNRMSIDADSKNYLKPGKWQHIAATWNGKIMIIYVDEKKVAETTHDPYSKPNISYENVPAKLIIGTRANAVLDEIKISSVVRY